MDNYFKAKNVANAIAKKYSSKDWWCGVSIDKDPKHDYFITVRSSDMEKSLEEVPTSLNEVKIVLEYRPDTYAIFKEK